MCTKTKLPEKEFNVLGSQTGQCWVANEGKTSVEDSCSWLANVGLKYQI